MGHATAEQALGQDGVERVRSLDASTRALPSTRPEGPERPESLSDRRNCPHQFVTGRARPARGGRRIQVAWWHQFRPTDGGIDRLPTTEVAPRLLPRLLLARTTPRHNLDTAVACNPAGQSAPRGIRTPTARCVAWCSASTSSAPDGHDLLRLGASSVQTDRVGSRRIVRMTIGMTKPGRDDPSASQDRRSSGIELQIWASCAQGKNGPRRASRLHCLAVTDRPGCALGVG
jgi:hypothetical protein